MKISVHIKAALLGTVLTFFVGCNHSNDKDVISESSNINNLNVDLIARTISQSKMEDSGYRFANPEYKKQLSAYATYYIREAKESAGLQFDSLTENEEKLLIDSFISSPNDLTDIYCTTSLIENKELISEEIKEKIAEYLDTLYVPKAGCYTLTNIKDNDKFLTNVYPTFIVNSIAESLNIQIEPIDEWLKKVSVELMSKNEIDKYNSRVYVMLLELLEKYNIEIDNKMVKCVIQMFESNLNNISDLQKDSDIYLPTFLMDYVEFCLLTNHSNAAYCDLINKMLCDGEKIRDDIYMKFDAYGLYAVVRTLELSGYCFSTNELDDLFYEFDSFQLLDGIYILPGYVESNFVDTYYANAIINELGIETTSDIAEYGRKYQDEIINSGIVNTYYYIDMLHKNKLMGIIENKEAIVLKFKASISDLMKEENLIERISELNVAIKGLETLNEDYLLSDLEMNKIMKCFPVSTNKQEYIYELTKLVEVMCLVCTDNYEIITDYCSELESEMISISKESVCNKLMLQFNMIEVFEKCGYSYSDEFVHAIKETLQQAQGIGGLFKGGDTDEDTEDFRNTYYAVVLLKSVY